MTTNKSSSGNRQHHLQLPATRLPERACAPAHQQQLDCRAYELVTPGYAGAVQGIPAGRSARPLRRRLWDVRPGAAELRLRLQARTLRLHGVAGCGQRHRSGERVHRHVPHQPHAHRVGAATFPNLKGSETAKEWGFACSELIDLSAEYSVNCRRTTKKRVKPNTRGRRTRRSCTRPKHRASCGCRPVNAHYPAAPPLKVTNYPGDYSHYVLSTTTPFVPVGSLTTEPGAVYDNDINGKTIQIVSQTARRRNTIS